MCLHTAPLPRFAHEGILNCARAIRDDLDRLGLLDQLLLGPQHPGGSTAADTGVGTGASKQQQQAEAEEGRFMRSSELPDCRGWTLMLTGHSLGGWEDIWGYEGVRVGCCVRVCLSVGCFCLLKFAPQGC